MSSRQARVSDAGAGLFLTPDELRALGIEPDAGETVTYSIRDGVVQLEAEETGD